ncbi:MAG: nitroreductase [Candidatus Diapherotrites archaeon]
MKNDVLDAIYKRRSVRKYSEKEVSEEIVKELINAGIMAPSARNTQPWNFSIVQGKEKIKEFSDKALEQRKILGKIIGGSFKVMGLGSLFYNAPLLIFISGKSDYSYLKDDVNLAVQNMFLAAYSLGLGSCWIGMAKDLNKNKSAKKELGIPADFEIVAPLIFGYPEGNEKETPKREPKILKWIK